MCTSRSSRCSSGTPSSLGLRPPSCERTARGARRPVARTRGVACTAMHGLAAPVYWLLRRWSGYRLYRPLALVRLLVLTLGGLAVPFWWLGEQAETVAGLTGFVIVSLLYLYAVSMVLLFATIVVARLVVRRLRSLIQPGKSAARQ